MGIESDEEIWEGRAGVGRIEAFSDGVIAIIITIMVLELHAPVAEKMEALWSLWPVFLAYCLSYAYVAIYWVNHHRLFGHARGVSNGLIWSNMALLFALSLIPFSTSYLGEQTFGRNATIFYLITLLLPAAAYAWVQAVIRRTGKRDPKADYYHVTTTRKAALGTVFYLSGIALSFVSPWFGIAAAAAVAILWVLPVGPLDRLFAPKHP